MLNYLVQGHVKWKRKKILCLHQFLTMASLADQFLQDIGTSSDSDDGSEGPSFALEAEAELPHLTDDQLNESETGKNPIAGESAPSSRALKNDAYETLLAKLDVLDSRLCGLSEETALNGEATHNLISECAFNIAKADEAIQSVHGILTKVYSPAFPELESLILNPLDYARVASLAVKHEDLSEVDFRPILPSAVVITVQVTASLTAGRPLPPETRAHVCALSELMQRLDARRGTLLAHLGLKVMMTAPNLCTIVGGEVAAKLLAHAGGLTTLARMPSGNVKVLGKKREITGGTSSPTIRIHDGVIHTCPLVMTLPPKLRSKCGDIIAGKATLAARVDAARGSRDGKVGRELRAGIEAKFAKMQERAPARTAKPLPVPGDEAKRRHRGGARARKEKERMGMTEMRRLSNRVKFGEAEIVGGNDLESEGMGMLNAKSGKVRVRAKKTDSVAVAAKRRLEKQKKLENRSEAEQLGIASSFVLPVGSESRQKDEANGPERTGDENRKTSNYFSAVTPFLGVAKRDRKIAKD